MDYKDGLIEALKQANHERGLAIERLIIDCIEKDMEILKLEREIRWLRGNKRGGRKLPEGIDRFFR